MKDRVIQIILFISIVFSCLAASNSNSEPIKIERAVPINSPENNSLLQRYVVLPSGFENQPVIIENSPEYTELLDNNKKLKEQVLIDQQKYTVYQKSVDQNLIDKAILEKKQADQLAKLQAEENKRSWWHWILGFSAFLFPAIGIGLVILCVMNPEIVPIVFNVFITIIRVIVNWISVIFKGFKSTADRIVAYQEAHKMIKPILSKPITAS